MIKRIGDHWGVTIGDSAFKEIGDYEDYKNYGWVCPNCGRSLAPWMSMCPCYEEARKTVVTTTTGVLPNNNYEHKDSITEANYVFQF